MLAYGIREAPTLNVVAAHRFSLLVRTRHHVAVLLRLDGTAVRRRGRLLLYRDHVLHLLLLNLAHSDRATCGIDRCSAYVEKPIVVKRLVPVLSLHVRLTLHYAMMKLLLLILWQLSAVLL